MPISPAWPSLKPVGSCHATGRPIPPGTPYVVALVEGDEGPVERREFLPDAVPTDLTPIATWRTTMPDLTARDRRERKAEADQSLRDLVESASGDGRGPLLRYAATRMLVRRRKIGVIRQSATAMTVAFTGGEPFDIAAPAVDDEALAAAVDEVAELTGADS